MDRRPGIFIVFATREIIPVIINLILGALGDAPHTRLFN
jgi:hypothetical protein